MQIFSVSEYNRLVKESLENELGELVIEGEVFQFKVYKEKLVYFYLKDQNSQMLCFGMVWDIKIPLEDGIKIRVLGYPSIFTKKGELHFRIQEIELLGEGVLQKMLETTRKKLEQEGLFRKDRKRPLPRFPERIGLITSEQAAALTDVLRILRNRWGGLEICFYPVSVQGAGAEKEIANALKYFQHKNNMDVLILTRGGGNLEDLQAFNSEKVAREIFASHIPIICGVGHERDESLADYVADMRASTPSNAAELAVPDKKEVNRQISYLTKQIGDSLNFKIFKKRQRLHHFIDAMFFYFSEKKNKLNYLINSVDRNFDYLMKIIYNQKNEIDDCAKKMESLFLESIKNLSDSLLNELRIIKSLDPKKILSRGYSIIVNKAGKVIKKSTQVKRGEGVKMKLFKGSLDAKILSKNND